MLGHCVVAEQAESFGRHVGRDERIAVAIAANPRAKLDQRFVGQAHLWVVLGQAAPHVGQECRRLIPQPGHDGQAAFDFLQHSGPPRAHEIGLPKFVQFALDMGQILLALARQEVFRLALL